MPRFRHRRTGREVEVPDSEARLYRFPRWEPLSVEVPTGSVAEVLEWAGDDPDRRAAALAVEKSWKKRKGIIEALS